MENKNSSNEIPQKESFENSFKETQRFIPINISLIKNIYTIPHQKDKNIIYINDIETLNESSITNNIEQNSIKYNENDSLSVIHSNKSNKMNNKNNRIKNKNKNNSINEELINKENENNLLKKEIFKLKEDINLYQTKILKLNQNNQNLEKQINDMKKEYQLKEKENSKKIEKLKNELKTKIFILNSFQEKIILKNQLIERLKMQLKKKETQINDVSAKLKNNFEININNNKNNYYTNSTTNKNKTKIISSKKSSTNKKITKANSKDKIISDNKNKISINLLQPPQSQYYHSNTQRINIQKNKDDNLYRFDVPIMASQRVISLKKRSKLRSPVLFNDKKRKLNIDNKDIKIKANLGLKFKCRSFSNKTKENLPTERLELSENIKNLRHFFSLKGLNKEDAFLKRYSNKINKNDISKEKKQSIKSITSDTGSYPYAQSDYNGYNNKIVINKLNKRKNNSFYRYINKKNLNQNLENKNNNKNIKRKFNEEIVKNMRKINDIKIIGNNLEKHNTFINKFYHENKTNFIYNNSINESNSILSNFNATANTVRFGENNSTKSDYINKKIFKDN